MSLSESETILYQNMLKHVAEITLNLMATKVTERPENFYEWCKELNRLCREELNLELLEPEQLPALKKLQDTLETGINIGQLKMLRIAPWPAFYEHITANAERQSLSERLNLLSYIQQIQSTPFADMIDEDLLAIAGKHTAKHDISVYKFDVELFSSSKAAKVFITTFTQNPTAFEQALSLIPEEGEVKKADYLNFVSAYQAIFQEFADGAKAPLVPATRLLALRRPDQFVALTNAKIEPLCQALSIAKFNTRDFNGYWNELIETIRTQAWWKAPKPENDEEAVIWQSRAILVDLFFFVSDEFAQGSNYVKLRDKPRKSSSTSTRKARSKESIEVIVDRALAEEGMPEYIKAQRESIISQAATGKSVDQVISLMRSIFG